MQDTWYGLDFGLIKGSGHILPPLIHLGSANELGWTMTAFIRLNFDNDFFGIR